jgi:hypothetical protein
MSTKQIHRTISKSKVRSNDGTTISIKAQKGKLQKRVGKKTKKSIIKAKLHKNASYSRSKSKPKTPSSTKNVKINPKKIEKKIREYEFTYWDVLYAHTRKVYQSYYSLMNYYDNLLFQYLYQKPIFSLGV